MKSVSHSRKTFRKLIAPVPDLMSFLDMKPGSTSRILTSVLSSKGHE